MPWGYSMVGTKMLMTMLAETDVDRGGSRTFRDTTGPEPKC